MEEDLQKKTPEEKKTERYAKIRATILAKYGPDYYSKLGSKGAKSGDNRPFRDKSIARKAGLISAEKRRKNKQN